MVPARRQGLSRIRAGQTPLMRRVGAGRRLCGVWGLDAARAACGGGHRLRGAVAQNPRLASRSSTSLWSLTTSVRPAGLTTGPLSTLGSTLSR